MLVLSFFFFWRGRCVILISSPLLPFFFPFPPGFPPSDCLHIIIIAIINAIRTEEIRCTLCCFFLSFLLIIWSVLEYSLRLVLLWWWLFVFFYFSVFSSPRLLLWFTTIAFFYRGVGAVRDTSVARKYILLYIQLSSFFSFFGTYLAELLFFFLWRSKIKKE